MLARVRALGFALALLLAARGARADATLAAAEDGSLGAWLVAGPLTAEQCAAVELGGVEARAGARISGRALGAIGSSSGVIDLEKELGAGNRAGPCALAVAVVEAERALDTWLLISADGGSDLALDGRPVWSMPRKRLRGGSWDPVRLELGAGRHVLVLRLRHPGEHWAFAARLLDAERLLPPAGVAWRLPGLDERARKKLAERLVDARLAPGLDARGARPRLALDFAGGALRDVALDVKVELGGRRLDLGRVPVGARAVHRFEARLPRLAPAKTERVRARIGVGPATLERALALSPRAAELLARARRVAESLKPSERWLDATALRATVLWRAGQLERAGGGARPSAARLERSIRRLEALLDAIEAGRDPLRQPGIVRLARTSALDGEPEPLTVHVPASYASDPERKAALAVVLHGYNGTGPSVLGAFLDADPNASAPRLDGFVLAPGAYGNAFYRGPGEHEVHSAIDWALSAYPIDPLRVSITGVSMGGTGSAFVALRRADRFSAASPLCGYHSYFVRRDTSKRPIRDWEKARMHHWSPASWADNGRNLPLFVAHGTKDWPLENSRVLIDRYRELGYSVSDEWPDTGHSVWEKTWDGARMWPWLSRQRRDPEPARVTLKTDALGTGRQAWVTITRLSQPGSMGSVDARVEGPRRVVVVTERVDAFELARPTRLAKDAAIDVVVHGTSLAFQPGELLALRREANGWTRGTRRPARGEKRAGVEGPIRAVFDGPLLFVWGSRDPRTARANREVAEAFARTRHGPGIHYRVLSDAELDAASEKSHALFLVGTERDHRLLGELARFSIRADGATLHVGPKTFARPGTGAMFVHPNPRHPDRSVVVVTGVDAAGIWRALSLPQLLPDFVVYDDNLSPAASEQILGADARVLGAGFFDHAWQLPATIGDRP